MNETVKDILSDKLKSARAKEGLDNYEIGQILGMKSLHYVQKAISKTPAQRKNVPKEAWKAIQVWTNTGMSLRAFGEKQSKIVKAAGELVGNLADEIPEDLPTGTMTAIEELEVKPKTNHEPEGEEGRIPLDDKPWDAEFLGMDPTPRIEEAGEARFPEGIHEPATYRIQDIPLDRLKVIFDAINELKLMGYQVDINITERNG